MNALILSLAVLCLLNLSAWLAFSFDKHQSRSGSRRISERTLLLISALGPLGSLAGVFQVRHKSRKGSFLLPYTLVLIGSLFLHVVAIRYFH